MLWENLYNALDKIANEILEAYKDALLMDGKMASGELINSMKYVVESGSSMYEISLNLEWYWKIIEEGVNGTEVNNGSPYSFKSKKIPTAPIYEWINVKGILPRPMTIRRRWFLRDGTERTKDVQILPTPEQLAHALSYSIPRKGFVPGKQLENVINTINNRIEEEIGEAVEKDLDKAMDFMFAWN